MPLDCVPRLRCCDLLAFFILLAPAIVAPRAAAQLPAAAGRQFTLSVANWKLFIPNSYQHRADGVVDMMIHFHGDPQTYWNNAAYAKLNVPIVTVNYSGLSSVYSTPFSDQTLFQKVVDEARAVIRKQGDFPDEVHWGKLAVSSFSAGYGAVQQILKNPAYRSEIDMILAADSLYATTSGDGTPVDSQLVDYETFANLAKSGQKTFLYSHSQVPTFTYESTGECIDEIMQVVGVSPMAYNATGLGTLAFYRHAKAGNFEMWGATGSDADSHLEHLRYIGEFLEELPLAKLTAYAADFNGNGAVDSPDLKLFTTAFGLTTAGNADNDADTDGADLLIWQRQLGALPASVPAFAAAPEPASLTLTLSLLASASLCWRHRTWCV